MHELTLKDVKFVFDSYAIDAEKITNGEIKEKDEYVGYFGNSVEELFENIKKNKIRKCRYFRGLKHQGFNDSYIDSLPALPVPLTAIDNQVRYCIPFGVVEHYKIVKLLTDTNTEVKVDKVYSVDEQTLFDLHQYLLDEYEEDNTNAEAIRLLKLLDKILGWNSEYYNPDEDVED